MLVVLLQNCGQLIGKDEFNQVWPGQIVEEPNLTVQDSSIRKALGDRKAAVWNFVAYSSEALPDKTTVSFADLSS